MARAFDPAEKIRIHETLLKSGCRLFGRHGFARTGIDAVTADAGIAKGTFYRFWDSKEAFFFACLEETEELFRSEVLEPILSSGRHPAEILGGLITETIRAADHYPIITQALDPILMNRLIRRLPPEILERHQEKDRGEFALIASSWNTEEFDPGVSPDILDGLFKGILMMTLHRSIIGDDIFPQVMETLSAVMASGFRSISDDNLKRKSRHDHQR